MNVLIIGATSAIAKAAARQYAARGECLFLIARDDKRLQEMSEDLVVRGADSVNSASLDLLQHDQHSQAIDEAASVLGTIDIALVCHGSLPDQEQAENDFAAAEKALDINGLSVISLVTALAATMKLQGNGKIAVVTSVAGDRGRQPNFVYGAAKAMVSTYLQGLRGKLLPHGVQVIDIRPGLVDSPMTAHLEKGALFSSPETVAAKIVKSIDGNRHTVYAPGYWRLIMLVVKSIPEAIFKRLKF
ncbi:MAG: SDR family oxidoreductase [Pseudomonadales bacterium]|nr:SDR family oxidoreductase [Pseudomonadales bacterium]